MFAGLTTITITITKEIEVFDEMNELYYNEFVHLDEDKELESDVIMMSQ